jgi:single-stranded DNA-specific DHH superfamily exonuclease
MIGILADAHDLAATAADGFAAALRDIDPARPIAVLGHFDADGLSAVAILVRALASQGLRAEPHLTGKGETPWNDTVRARLSATDPAALVVVDLGTRADPVLPGCPTVVIDHHLPTGTPEGAVVISGNGLDPEPTTALLAWWAAGSPPDLLWLAALGLIGDMADEGWPELAHAQARWGKTALKDATSLVNAPRRTAAADPSPALRLLLTGDGPKAITKGTDDDARALVAAKAEVRDAVEAARKVAPRVVGDVAMIRFHSGCQIHPLIAQQWRGRLKDKIVLAANTGYRPGWVHFAARSATGRNLVDFLAEHRPDGADGRYGNGHAQATGGALPLAQWNRFVTDLGFPEQQVPA